MARAKLGAGAAAAGQAWNTGFQAGAATARQTITNNQSKSWVQGLQGKDASIGAAVAAAFSSGTWFRGVQTTGDQGWRDGMMNKGLANMAAGSARGAAHYGAFRQQWDPALQQQIATLPKRADYGTNKQRQSQLSDWMHSQKGKYRHLWRGGAGG